MFNIFIEVALCVCDRILIFLKLLEDISPFWEVPFWTSG